MSMSSSGSVSETGSGMERVGMTLTCGLPCSLFRKVSLYLIGKWGHSCLSLAVDRVDCPLVLCVSDSEPELLHADKLESCVQMVDVGEEVSDGEVLWSSVVICVLPFKEIICLSNFFKHKSARGRSPEMGLN